MYRNRKRKQIMHVRFLSAPYNQLHINLKPVIVITVQETGVQTLKTNY
jgi:hypothetical protein